MARSSKVQHLYDNRISGTSEQRIFNTLRAGYTVRGDPVSPFINMV